MKEEVLPTIGCRSAAIRLSIACGTESIADNRPLGATWFVNFRKVILDLSDSKTRDIKRINIIVMNK